MKPIPKPIGYLKPHPDSLKPLHARDDHLDTYKYKPKPLDDPHHHSYKPEFESYNDYYDPYSPSYSPHGRSFGKHHDDEKYIEKEHEKKSSYSDSEKHREESHYKNPHGHYGQSKDSFRKEQGHHNDYQKEIHASDDYSHDSYKHQSHNGYRSSDYSSSVKDSYIPKKKPIHLDLGHIGSAGLDNFEVHSVHQPSYHIPDYKEPHYVH